MAGRSVVVTGAASGIGRETALVALQRGAHVFAADTNAEGLDETEKLAAGHRGTMTKAVVDVADAEQVRAFAGTVHAAVDAVDLVGNNAGVALGARFQDTSLEDWRWIVGINLMGVVNGCHFFVPSMVARRRGGHIVNVASMAAYMPTPITTAYCVTKAAVASLSECLRVELRQHGIGVTALCPGFVDTPLVHATRRRGLFATQRAKNLLEQWFSYRGYPANRVARRILAAARGGRTVAPVAPEAWLLYFLKRTAPGLALTMSDWVGRRLERSLLVAGAQDS
jgi:NAD(P)-dependent dehydrogenase (short-subunit alcohol dehydrogenase family)